MLGKIVTGVVMFCCCGMVLAQEPPKAELFGGYSHQATLVHRLNGWNASIAANINRWLGIAGDCGGAYAGFDAAGTGVKLDHHSFMVGPRFARRTEKLTSFAHVRIGRAQATARLTDGLHYVNPFGFALMVGAGLDVNLGKRLAARVLQADYISAWSKHGQGHNLRISAGLVVKLR